MDLQETEADQAAQADPATQATPETQDHQDPTENQEALETMVHLESPADQPQAHQTSPEIQDHPESQDSQVFPETQDHPAEMAHLAAQVCEAHQALLEAMERTVSPDPKARPVQPVSPERGESARSTAPSTAVFSSRMAHEERNKPLAAVADCFLASVLLLLSSHRKTAMSLVEYRV
jgi:hypothetical protein